LVIDTERAENELYLSRLILKMSEKQELQKIIIETQNPKTFYSAVISHSYYSIFYMAKAYLSIKRIKIKPPNEHKKTFLLFKKFADRGILDNELLRIYEDILIKADELLGIFKHEKDKRANFTYQRLAQANLEPAKESISNSEVFYKHLYNLCEE